MNVEDECGYDHFTVPHLNTQYPRDARLPQNARRFCSRGLMKSPDSGSFQIRLKYALPRSACPPSYPPFKAAERGLNGMRGLNG